MGQPDYWEDGGGGRERVTDKKRSWGEREREMGVCVCLCVPEKTEKGFREGRKCVLNKKG